MLRWLSVFLLLASAEVRAAQPDVVVVARLLRVVQGGPPCGRSFTVGEQEYGVVRTERGTLAAPRIVVEVACPTDVWAFTINGLTRLSLSTTRPRSWPALEHKSTVEPRLYLVQEASLAPEILGMRESTLDTMFPRTSTDGDWIVHGDLAVKLEDGTVTRVRLSLPPHWPMGDHPDLGKLGFGDAGIPDSHLRGEQRWSGRGDHRIAAGVAGSRRGSALELWRAP
ncbi:MAG: hypothetical protein ABI321_04000 [Polyangia bacterium]